MAGTITVTSADLGGGVSKYTVAWVSAADGSCSGTFDMKRGALVRATFVPNSGGTQPTDAYDLTIADASGIDIVLGIGANLSNASASETEPATDFEAGTFTLTVANAGNAKGGTIILLVGASGTGTSSAVHDAALLAAVGGAGVVRPTIAVGASPDYSDGDCVGGLITLEVDRGVLSRFTLRTKLSGGITVQTFVHIFDSNPTASTTTDNAALVIHADDRAKLLKTVAITASSWVAPKGASPWYTAEVIGPGAVLEFLEYEIADGASLYFVIEADGVINFAATDDLAVIISEV